MAKGKKYDYRLREAGAVWRAEIVRRVTSKQTVISKSQDGFASKAQARAWGERELQSFIENQSKRNRQRSEKRDLEARQLAQKQQHDAATKASKLAAKEAASIWPQTTETSSHD